MVQTDNQHSATGVRERENAAREFYLILYPKELEDEVIQSLESTGVPGYTEMPKMIGRGRHTKHFDNAVWPGATGAVFSTSGQTASSSSPARGLAAVSNFATTRSTGPAPCWWTWAWKVSATSP